MNKIKQVLQSFVESKSKFLDLKDGQEETVRFLGAEPVTTNYQGKTVKGIRYSFELNDKEILWDRTSREFAKQMSVYSKDDVLNIKVFGKGNQTKYDIEKIN